MAEKRKKDFGSAAAALGLLPLGGGFIGVAFYIILSNPVGGFTSYTVLISFLLGCGGLGTIGLGIGAATYSAIIGRKGIWSDELERTITFAEVEILVKRLNYYTNVKVNKYQEEPIKQEYQELYDKVQKLEFRIHVANNRLLDSETNIPADVLQDQYVQLIDEVSMVPKVDLPQYIEARYDDYLKISKIKQALDIKAIEQLALGQYDTTNRQQLGDASEDTSLHKRPNKGKEPVYNNM